MPEVNNPFDLTKSAKEYNWEEAHDMKIIIDVKQARNSGDCFNQLFCWMRDHFVKITKLEMLGGKEEEIKELQKKFQDEFFGCVRYEDA